MAGENLPGGRAVHGIDHDAAGRRCTRGTLVTTEPRPVDAAEARPADPDPPGTDNATIDSYPQSRIENSQPEGIGRVVALRDLCAWNNLGRNIVVASSTFQPRAIFDQTRFPDDDELSQYDLDIHAILEVADATVVVVLNHLGLLRAFRATSFEPSGRVSCLEPAWTSVFADDVERVVAVRDRLIGSRPCRLSAGGVLVSQPLGATPGPTVSWDVGLETWGVVTALGALSAAGQDWLAVGGESRVGLMSTRDGTLGPERWEVRLGFQPAVCDWDGKLLWVAGSDVAVGVDDYDWEQLRGGGFVGLDPDDGSRVVEGRFTEDLAWGNGGTAVVVTDSVVCGIGRMGALHLYSTRDGSLLARTPPIASHPLGIAHAAVIGGHILFGFNRAGYQLRAVTPSTIGKLASRYE